MKPGRIHLIGAGGVGMAGLAVLLKNRGFDVSGCDVSASSRLDWLRRQGIEVFSSHDVSHLEGIDEVVVTPAVPLSVPERAAASAVRSRGEILAGIVNEAADSIAVCGSHGKTTTSSFIARMLVELGEKVEWAIGGEAGDFPVAGGSKGGVLVVEADESDATLALYHAKTLVVTNVDYDHPDRFPTRDEYKACFDVARSNASCVIEGETLTNEETAVRTLIARGHSREDVMRALAKVARVLPDRRFEMIIPGVYTDYAHHPAEIRYALRRAREKAGNGTLRVLFQPHRFSRTKRFLEDFACSFDLADELVLCPVYPAFEEMVAGGTSADLYKTIRDSGRPVYLARSCLEAWEHASASMKDGDVTVLLGAGDIIDTAESIRKGDLRSFPRRTIYIGAGSNTWKSDLQLNVGYVKTQGPASKPGSTLGIPWMAGIPGTIGGWVVMNAGAFGHSISELVESVKVDGKWIPADQCSFSYRSSSIDGEVSDVRFIAYERDSVLEAEYLSRRPSFPPGTKGSVFKNPPGGSAGRLLENASCKGLSVGGCRVWEGHANVIVSGPGATASDFLALASLMKNAVKDKFDIELEPEVRGLALP